MGISAYPMFLNPPNQFFENILGIPLNFNIKRVLFRTSLMLLILFLAESLPSFSGILQLISSIFVTCLTFVFPPLFYMRLVDSEAKTEGSKTEPMGIVMRILCIQAIIIGAFGGILSFISSVEYIV